MFDRKPQNSVKQLSFKKTEWQKQQNKERFFRRILTAY